ncbi:hypothetical protein H4J51_11820 [Colwellia sp. MB02u-18]|uniref:hypothetical protein n=1 Tax=unclassified Colwellia TaxID=196834 RepID=UPI0015F72911|nr:MULTISPECIES: hypothetical protein [unclassified Colwellia]MBA6225865.1 hypothetical protein [Colwellia sp. MB3u-45]MBA6267101.1 hypothetical protein [Colwellia sp. MB3u-43]MBA6322025.1 hypothetical protein [Colwellia sp. MB02u-19]MBA6325255.1 hypothetical protein [Colwellia sp. MB02u-18]MBA6330274.1 hypothetical protein [Colwellia sp. MB02u-12]
MDSTLPLYRQLSRQFFLLALSFSLLFLLGFWLYFQSEQDLALVKDQQLPALEQHHQRQLLLIKNNRLLNDLLDSRSALKFDESYQTLNENLKNISALSQNNKRLLAQLTQRLKMQAENVTRLTESARRNLQLKDSVIIQLILVTDSLSHLIAEQTSQQKDLYRQISQDNLTKRVITLRAKALSNLVNSLNINRELHQGIIDTLVMFNQLDLQYDLVEFNYIQQEIQLDIMRWLANASNVMNENSNETGLVEQISVLNRLLFSEQNTFAKWHGQLRRAVDLQAELAKQKAELIPLLDHTLVVQPLKPSLIKQQFFASMVKANIDVQPKHYTWLITGVFLLLSLIFISFLFSLRRKIKCFGKQSAAVVEEFVTTGHVVAKIPGLEVTTMLNAIKQLSQPLHREADFEQQHQEYQRQIVFMSRHSGVVFWQMPLRSEKQQQQLSALLGVDVNNQHWRQCFSRADVRAILSLARHAKKHQGVEKISLISNQEQALALTLEYVAGLWCGSLSNAEEYQVLKDSNAQLQQQLKQQNQADKLAIITRSDKALGLVNSLMLQRQLVSITQGDEQFAYQQLRQLARWNEQQKTCAQLRLNDFVLTLSRVTLANEMHTVLANVSLAAGQSNNCIYLHMAENLASSVTLESELFQAMIATICHKILKEQRGAELNIALQVIDVNSGQQTVQISFLLNKPSDAQMLSQVINELAFDDEITADFAHATEHYLRDLQLVFNVSNKASQLLESAGKFSFEFSLTIAEELNKTSEHQPVNLAKCALLVIATDKVSRERICHQLGHSKAIVETMQDLSLFRRQMSIKHLMKYRLDVIILSPEVYCSDYDLITQHLSSLPAKIQPKILVIQPLNCTRLQRAGLFSASNLPWFAGELITNIIALLSNNNQINLLVEPEIFSPYRFIPSQVEVLLGVIMTSKHQVLLRILHWLGLQVTVVSQQDQLEHLWQSGRYLVAIGEFSSFNHTVNSTVNNTLTPVRGLFALSNNKDKLDDFFDKCNLPTSWHSGYLAPTLDIQQLIQQLSPWLKSAAGTGDNQAILASPADKQDNKYSVMPNTVPDKSDVTVEQVLNMADIEQSLDFSFGFEQINKPTAEALDLTQYAENQGSAELAAFMLDEYLADISTNLQALSSALAAQDYRLALALLQSLTTLANVIAAKPLLAQCRQLSQLLSPKALNGAFSVAEKEPLQRQLNHLKLCLLQLTEFAEAI